MLRRTRHNLIPAAQQTETIPAARAGNDASSVVAGLTCHPRFGRWECCLLWAMVAWGSTASCQELQLSTTSKLRLATVQEGRAVVSKRDTFVQQMGDLERSIRLRVAHPVTVEMFLEQSAQRVQEWSAEDRGRLEQVFLRVQPLLQKWQLPWPREILLVRTDDGLEFGLPHCRGPAVLLSRRFVHSSTSHLSKVLVHELFHVLSSTHPDWRQQMYPLIGFTPCRPVDYPESISARRLTNPDAPWANAVMKLPLDGRLQSFVPLLYSRIGMEQAGNVRNLDQVMEFRMMAVEPTADGWQPALHQGQPRLLRPAELPNFYDKIGRNTTYIIHPEEILAENFVLLMMANEQVATPQILADFRAFLEQVPKQAKP